MHLMVFLKMREKPINTPHKHWLYAIPSPVSPHMMKLALKGDNEKPQ